MYNIKDFGALQNSVCTLNIQAAIDKCHEAGGGVVTVPCGLYITGTIYLKDNVEINLQSGAILKASTNLDDYNDEDAYIQNWSCREEEWVGKHLIIALECTNISITGNGVIDGSGDSFFGTERIFYDGYAWEGGYVKAKDKFLLRPGQLVSFIECKNVKIDGVTLKNMPCWGFFMHGCEVVQIHGIKVENPAEFVNTDGIDIDCCRFVTISDCIINTGDDAIAVRCNPKHLKNYKKCENIVISNCILASNSSAFRIGIGTGEINHVRISNIIVSKAGHLLTFSPAYKGDSFMNDITLSDVSAYGVLRLMECELSRGAIRNVTIKDINATAKAGIYIMQKESGSIYNMQFKNINLNINEKMIKDEKYILHIENVDNIKIDAMNISYNESEWENASYIKNNKKIEVKNSVID